MNREAAGKVAVLGVGAFVPGYAGLSELLRDERSEEHTTPVAELVPLRQRRRASLLSRAFADAYLGALERAALAPDGVASVFGSALGEASTMIQLLDQMWGEGESLSPMRFTTSVHNAASGMVSIATGNRGVTTSLGADFDTPAMALLEGMGMVLSAGTPVIVCCADEAPPEGLVTAQGGWDLLAAAIAIGPADSAPSERPRLAHVAIEPPSQPAPRIRESVARNPAAGLIDLGLAIESGASGRIALDRGLGRGFSVALEGAEG